MTTPSFRLALAQLNPRVGDVAGNADKARAARQTAAQAGAELVMLPQLFLCGYPPEDLVLLPAFQDACRKTCETLARETADGGPALLIGLPWLEQGKLYNAYALLDGGMIQSVRFKVALPEFGVFDEARIFAPGPLPGPVVFRDKIRLGLVIGEDIAGEEVVECLAETGSEVLLAPACSPYTREAGDERMNIAVARVVESGLPLIYLNQIGGQDEAVFDGASFLLNGDRTLAQQLPAFREALVMTDWERERGQWRCRPGALETIEGGDEVDYAACVLGLRDYADKMGFGRVALSLSGTVDSALGATMAVDAFGSDRVSGIMVFSHATTKQAHDDAAFLADALGIALATAAIDPARTAVEAALAVPISGAPTRSAVDLQGRLGGLMLAVFSESLGALPILPDNKSDLFCRSTPESEATAGFNPIKDLYSTEVHRLAALRNRWKPAGARGPDGVVIPEATRSGTADLGEVRRDKDGLPPYETLDAILAGLIEQGARVSDLIERGYDAAAVMRVETLLRRAEPARRRAAPGVKISARTPGRDRRYPIVNAFVDTGAAAHQPDAELVRGVGRGGGESFDF